MAQQGADCPVDVADGEIELDRVAMVDRALGQLDQRLVEGMVETVINGHVEGTVEARRGDWIVQQHTGEVMVIDDDAFRERYAEEGSNADAS